MSRGPPASVIINNRDYGRFLADAIDSALAQTYSATEVIVVDDGSRDHSRDVIAAYGARITPLLKSHGGQASAFNAGFEASRGDVILFLDSDDMLLPTAVEQAVERFDGPEVVKVHWCLWEVDKRGRRTGQRHPDAPLPYGDQRDTVRRLGPTTLLAPPTSGNAWSRSFLGRVLPIPERLYTISADKHLLELAPFFGVLRLVREPQALYRVHGANSQLVASLDERLQRELAFYEDYCGVLRRHEASLGVRVDPERWKRNSWWHRQELAIREIATLPESAGPVILVDDGSWGVGTVAGRERLPFLEKGGLYAGQPNDAAMAIGELERLRREGAAFIVFVWPTFWWLDHYGGLARHLRTSYSCVLESERVVGFDLRSTVPGVDRDAAPAS